MAIMWPKKLPTYITSDILRSTECRVYYKLNQVLEDQFVVFYSRPWLGLTHLGEEKDGECDFLIAHPDLGILALEVKGGAVTYDPSMDSWTTCDRWGFVHRIKNPVNQARTSKYQILKKLQTAATWIPRRIHSRHGVIFPDSERPNEDLGADMPLPMFCFSDDFRNNLRGWIMDRFGENSEHTSIEYPLDPDGLKALEDLLVHPFKLHFPLGDILDDDDKEIETLTHQQFILLTYIQDIPRAAISGGAGTGKTILAMEEAVHRCEKGMKVLVTCYNRPLAVQMRQKLQIFPNLTVSTFHELCVRFAKNEGIAIPEGLDKKVFDEEYPKLLMQALSKSPNNGFDVIIVDEGQDFLPTWYSALNKALNPKGIIRIFYDSNQIVYNNPLGFPIDIQLSPIRLSLNLRNTQRIHEAILPYYKGPSITPIGPVGVKIEWIEAESFKDICFEIDRRVHQLLHEEYVRPHDIAVLMETYQNIIECTPNECIGGVTCRRADDPKKDALILDTVRRFKGLESRIIILAATPKLIADRELIYVGLSRARAHLIVIGNADELRHSAI